MAGDIRMTWAEAEAIASHYSTATGERSVMIQTLKLVEADGVFMDAIDSLSKYGPLYESLMESLEKLRQAIYLTPDILQRPRFYGDDWYLIACEAKGIAFGLVSDYRYEGSEFAENILRANLFKRQDVMASYITSFEKSCKKLLMSDFQKFSEAVSNSAAISLTVATLGFGLGLYACRKSLEACVRVLAASPTSSACGLVTMGVALGTSMYHYTASGFFKPSPILSTTVADVVTDAQKSIQDFIM